LAREALAPAVESIVGLDLHKDEGLPWAAVYQSWTDVADLHGYWTLLGVDWLIVLAPDPIVDLIPDAIGPRLAGRSDGIVVPARGATAGEQAIDITVAHPILEGDGTDTARLLDALAGW